jgi:DinB superfamily
LSLVARFSGTIEGVDEEFQVFWFALEVRRKTMTDRVAVLDNQAQIRRRRPSEFSPVEVIMHMALAETVSLEVMRQRPPIGLTTLRPKPSWIFAFALNRMEAGNGVPTIGSMMPKSDVTLREADARWTEVRNEIHGLLSPLPTMDHVALKHPIFGLLSARDLLQLLSSHTRYHEIRFPA